MSVAGQRHRLADDTYYTPPWVVRVLYRELYRVLGARHVLDPCAGDGTLLGATGPVALLLRANWLFPAKRNRIARPNYVLGLPKRPVFAAFCLGLPKRKGRARVKGCGRVYVRGTVGECECGGRIGPQSDATDYAWHVWSAEPYRAPRGASAFYVADSDLCDELAEAHP